MRILFFTFLLLSFSIKLGAQEKEVLLIGTMHTVPKIVKKSYKPLLRRAIKYNPDAIYVESPRSNDDKSWEYLKDGWSKNYADFYSLSDSLKRNFDFDQMQFENQLSKKFDNLSNEDLDYIINSFGYLRDNANYEFYKYIKKYGVDGSKKATRHEDGDLTAKLALELRIKMLKSMDDQQTNQQYHDAWKKCAQEGRTNGDNAINKKLNKKDYNSAIIPALFRGLGMHVNKRKSLERLHQLASFTYVQNQTEGCSLGERFWDERNERMAKNIGEQIMNGSNKKNVVIVGASHIHGLEKELKENYPDLKVKLINE
ncbi:MAG: DUF5694 domain-containing protein [Bacteroidota bacterium]